MSSPQRRFVLQQPVVADVGCGCRRSIFSTLFTSSSSSYSSLKQRISKSLSSSSPSSPTSSLASTVTPFSSSPSPARQPTGGLKGEKQSSTVKRGKTKERNGVVEESVAVVKDSLNPYLDFYESMLAMVMEMEMCCWEDLCDLLHRYLTLNSARHHHIILRAFADIWNNVYFPPEEVAGGSTATAGAELIPRNRTGDGKMEYNDIIN